MTSILLQKAFFSKNNCLKVTLNKNQETYFEFGTPKPKQEKGWNWKPVKFNDMELGEIILILEDKKQTTSFFHSFNNETTQIWISKKNSFFTIKTNTSKKSLQEGEQVVLRELLKHIIVRKSIKI
ncbi:MAG: hypothetical protein ACQESC_04260 [Nanobdellota archaeon]